MLPWLIVLIGNLTSIHLNKLQTTRYEHGLLKSSLSIILAIELKIGIG